MSARSEDRTPYFYPIKGGWAAAGRGWAVHGKTKEEAAAKFAAAVRKHDEIMSRGTEPAATEPPGRRAEHK